MSMRSPVRAAAPVAQSVRAVHTGYRIVAQEEIQKEEDAHEARVKQGVDALEGMGFNRLSITRQEVVWAEHDQYRHVNNVHYLRWFESARMRWIQRMSRTLDPVHRDNLVQGRGIGVIVAASMCRYRRPVTYPDTVLISVGTLPMQRRDRCILRQRAYSVAQQTVVAEADFDVVAYDYENLRKADFPPEMQAAMEAWVYHGPDAHKSRL
ncbi:hypothetical protein MCAP1_000287 [Malassezia caprae]|uniref:Uncharacterized protein n=1 Tax=Malassezia caprae TaxID=1381934 RepID=A0AAF0E3V2_9BASI|nr:hypothetical protein MCAP1_000287 [Malassezia caprae]